MNRVLDGIRVIELGTMITGPYCGMLLADLGAEVIKVENPDGGDPYRRYAPGFAAINMNKRSMAVDLRSEAGRAALLKLVETADVLFENFRPGVMERLGLPDAALRARNPRLVNCSITGFGPDGPYKDRPAYDTAVQSLSGFLSLLTDAENPSVPGPPIADGITGIYACYGILGALVERGRTGKGRRLEVAMIEALIHFANEPFGYYFSTGEAPGPRTRSRISQSFAFKCADGKLVGVHLSSQEKFWRGLLATADRLGLAEDPRFKTYAARIENHAAIDAELAAVFRTEPQRHWVEKLAVNEVPFAPVYSADEVVDDPQIQHLGTFFSLDRPGAPPVRGITSPIIFDGERAASASPPPALGQHTEEILRSVGMHAAVTAKG